MNIKVVRLTLLAKRAILVSENLRVLFGEFRQYFLTVLHLHQRRLKTLDCVQNLFLQVVVLDGSQCFLENVVAKLVVDQALHDKVHSGLQSLRETESLYNLTVIILESPFENFVNVVVSAVQAFLNHV